MTTYTLTMVPVGSTIPTPGATAPVAAYKQPIFTPTRAGDYIGHYQMPSPPDAIPDVKQPATGCSHASRLSPCTTVDLEDVVQEPKPPTKRCACYTTVFSRHTSRCPKCDTPLMHARVHPAILPSVVTGPKLRLVGIEENPGPLTDFLRGLKFHYYGNYGGPGYSAGKFTEKPDWSVKPKDAQDALYRMHDYDYGRMDKSNADALLVERLRKLSGTEAGIRGQLAAAGFHIMTMGKKAVRPKYSYPWDEKMLSAPRHNTNSKPDTLPPPGRQGAGERKTAATMAVEPNPGPPKGRSRSASRKGSRKPSRSKSQRRPKSAKGSRKRSRSRKGGGGRTGGPRAGPGARGKGAASSAGQKNQGQTFTRTDLVFSGTVNGNTPTGSVLYSAAVNPSGKNVGTSNSIVAAYLNYESAKWEQFDCQVHFTVKATGATTIAGTFTHGIDSDVTDALPVGTIDAVQRLTGQGGNTNTWAAGGKAEFNRMNASKATNRLWVQPASDSDSRLVAKGKYWLIVNEPTTSYFAAGSGQQVNVNFQVFAHYTFRFFNATLEIPGGLAGGQSGLWWDQAAAGSATDPLAMAAVTGASLWNLAPINAQNDLWVFTDGSASFILFGVGGNDNVNYVHITVEVAGTSPTVAPSYYAGATLIKANVSSSATDQTTSLIVGLSNTSALWNTAVTAFRKQNGGFQTLLTPTFRHYGGVYFSGGGTITASSVTVGSFQTYVPTYTDRMLQCAGPGTMDYKHIATWDYTTTLEKHLEHKKSLDRQREQDIRLIVSDQKRLEAEHRLDMESLSLRPNTPVSDEDWKEPPLESKSARAPQPLRSILKR